MPAVRRLDHFAVQKILREVPGGAGLRGGRRGGIGVLPIDARNPASQRGELILEIAHSVFAFSLPL
jgi:hypothetical protein